MPYGGNHVFPHNPASGAAPLDPGQINPEFSGQASNGRPGGLDGDGCRPGGRLFDGHRCRPRSRGDRCGRRQRRGSLDSGGSPDRCGCWGTGGRGGRHRRCGGCLRGGGRRTRGFEQHERLSDLHRIPLFHQHLRDEPTRRARHLNHRLVGLDFQERLARLHDVALGHKNSDHIAGGNIFAQIGQFELGGHGGIPR